MQPLVLHVLIALGLIALNACFVLAEFALVKIRASRLELLARHGNQRAIMVQGMLHNLDVYLSAIQIGITMTSLGLGWIGEPAVAHILEQYLRRVPFPYTEIITHGLSFAAAFGVITFLHILFGELVPRSVGLQKSETIILWSAIPLRIFYLAIKTPVTLLANASIWILRLLRMRPASEAESQLSEEELRIILGTSEDKAGFSLERSMLMENIFDFGKAKVSDAMVYKERVAYLSTSRTWEENLNVIRSQHFFRYPLCRTNLDTAFGFVHIRDLLLKIDGPLAKGPVNLAGLKRDLKEVSTEDSLQKLLQQFTSQGTHISLVKDPSGSAVGIICLEDVLEELVGEIHGEFDSSRTWSLLDILAPSAVEVGMEATDREVVIRQLLTKLKSAHPALNLEEAMAVTWGRELNFSTGVGHGVAMPHGRLAQLDHPLLAIGRAAKTFSFLSPDRVPVRLVFLILTPAGTPAIQVKIISRIASFISNENIRRRLLRAKTPEQLVTILKTADTVLAE